MSDYMEYQEIPAWEQAVWKDGMVANPKGGMLIWGGKNGVVPPPVGEKINVSMNGLGNGNVVGYFSEESFLGLLVILDNAPEWFIKQNGDAKKVCHVFGPEWKPLEAK